MAGTTVGRRLGPRARPRQPAEAAGPAAAAPLAEPLFVAGEAEVPAEAVPVPVPDAGAGARAGAGHAPEAEAGPGPGQEREPDQAAGPLPAGPDEAAPAGPRITEGQLTSRYAGAMLLHAFGGQVDAGVILAAATGDGRPAAAGARRFADVGLLSAASICFALGAAATEQFKHLTAEAAGPLAGLSVLPDLRTLRPRLAAIADATGPLELQAMFARAMLEANPVTSGVYYVDDHFVPYAGAKPAGKGWNSKRGKAEKGRADTTPTSPRTAAGRCALSPASRPAWSPP